MDILRDLCAHDPRVKVIVNTRNFGHVRSPYHGLLQACGDAVCSIAADLQDPPELIREFVARWEEGYKVVVGVKKESLEKRSMFFVRGLYYRLINRLSDVPLIENFTGFGLYDRDRDRRAARDRRSVPVLPRPDLRPRLRAHRDPLHAAAAQARRHQEQLLHALRPRHARHHEPLQGAAAPGDDGRLSALGPGPRDLAHLPRAEAHVLADASTSAWRRCSSASTSSAACSSSSSASSASTSDRSRRRSTIGRMSSRRSASISNQALSARAADELPPNAAGRRSATVGSLSARPERPAAEAASCGDGAP